MVFKGYKKMTHDTWMYVLNQDKSPLLANVPPQRILVIYGTRDPYFPPGNIPLFEKIYPTLKSVPIDSAGHMPHYEKAEVVNPMMEEFVKAIP